jgi:hypothetical protein
VHRHSRGGVYRPAEVTEGLDPGTRTLATLKIGALVSVTAFRTLDGSWENPSELGTTRILCAPLGDGNDGGAQWGQGWVSMASPEGVRLFEKREDSAAAVAAGLSGAPGAASLSRAWWDREHSQDLEQLPDRPHWQPGTLND